MDSNSEGGSNARLDSAGAHSVRSQLIVVSPRSSESADQQPPGGEDEFTVIHNPTASIGNGDGPVVVSIEMTNIEGQTHSLTDDPPLSPSPPPPSGGTASLGGEGPHPLQGDGSTVQSIPSEELSPIEHVLRQTLRTRPTIRQGTTGRDASMRFRARTAVPRRQRAYHSFSHVTRRPRTTGGQAEREIRNGGRRSSLPDLNDDNAFSTINLEEDLFDIMNDEERPTPPTLEREADIRRSTRRLRERIEMHHDQEEERTRLAQANVFADFYYVKWPKIKSQLRVAASYRLWNGHMKEVEGHFGTAVVSYFVYLRWLFVMNLIIFAFWFGLVVIPNAIYIEVEQPARTASLLSCSYPFSTNSNTSCSDDASITDSDNVFYLLSVDSAYSCTAPPGVNTTTLRECVIEAGALNGTSRDIAVRESSASPVVISDMMPNMSDCTFEAGTMPNPSSFQQVRVCASNIAPYIPWYQFVIDFALGQGIFNETVLFYGRYGNTDFGGYNLPVAYLFVTGIVYTISVVLLVYKMGQAYNESYVEVGRSKSINFCNKLFTAWDFNITDPNTARLRRVQIRTDFEEELANYESRNQKRTPKELAIVIIIRIFTNLFTVLVLAAGAVIIFYATQFGLENQSSDGLSFEGLVTPVVITTLNLVLPFLFSFLARFERFKTQSGEIKMTLLRAILVRLASLFVLIATIYILIRCTQQITEESGTGTTVCSFDLSSLVSSSSGNTTDSDDSTCPVCWETFIGQEFYKLGLTNFIVSAASTVGVETFRNIASRIKYKGLGKKIGKGNFNIPKSILDLIYTQSLLWLGFFFSPMLPAVILITSFVLFYVKKYSLIYNLEPDRRGATKTSRNNFLYLLLMLATLGFYLILVGVALGSFRPSESCGPFRGMTSFFAVVSEYINTFSCVVQLILDYFATASFVIPVIAFLLLIIYTEHVLLRSRKAKFELIKKQLILEGANVTHIVGRLDNVLQRVADHRQEMMNTINVTSPQHSNPRDSASSAQLRQRHSLDVSGGHQGESLSQGHPTPLRQRIEQLKQSVSEEDATTAAAMVDTSSQERRGRKRSSVPSIAEDETREARGRKRSSVPSIEEEQPGTGRQRKESSIPLIVEDSNEQHETRRRKRRSVPSVLEDPGEHHLSSSTENAQKRVLSSAL